jgi:hypothetical protein
MELDLKLLLIYIKEDDYEGMLRFIPEGIEHRASRYNKAEDFKLEGSYQEDARYIYPARDKMKEACLDLCIKNLKE